MTNSSQEIKFRAWDNLWEFQGGGKHVYGDEVYVWWVNDKARYTLERYAGRKDTVGWDIYEGDVVKIDLVIYPDSKEEKITHTYNSLVKWSKRFCAFMVWSEDEMTDGYLLGNCCLKMKVIGNIHKNPKLLEVQK